MQNQQLRWNWINAKERFNQIHIDKASLVGMLESNELALRTKAALLAGVDDFYRPMELSQPRTWKMLTSKCQGPMVIQNRSYPELVDIVALAGELLVFVEPFDVGDEQIDWNDIRRCLPEFMHCYYVNFNGMHASFERLNGPIALNLPANVRKWRRISDYLRECGLPKKSLTQLKATLGNPENIDIILQTSADDLVVINRNINDGVLYVIPEGKLDSFFELKHPVEAIDKLCAHVLTGTAAPFELSKFR